MDLFRRFLSDFTASFGSECGFLGPPEAIRDAGLARGEMSVAIATLGVEWMSQAHDVARARDDGGLDPQFQSLLKHHWQEEAQHARLDGLLRKELAGKATPVAIERAIDKYFEISGFLDGGLRSLICRTSNAQPGARSVRINVRNSW